MAGPWKSGEGRANTKRGERLSRQSADGNEGGPRLRDVHAQSRSWPEVHGQESIHGRKGSLLDEIKVS